MSTKQRIVLDGISLPLRTWTTPTPQAPPVLLLPATGYTCEDWEPAAAQLARARTVHALDLHGHGDSNWPGTHSLQLMAHDVTGVLHQDPGVVRGLPRLSSSSESAVPPEDPKAH